MIWKCPRLCAASVDCTSRKSFVQKLTQAEAVAQASTCVGQVTNPPYMIVMVAAFENTPPAWITTCWFPDGAFAGTRTFTWYNPTKPGARPEKITSAPMLPMVTTGVLTMRDKGSTLGAGCPLPGTGLTAPRPVA